MTTALLRSASSGRASLIILDFKLDYKAIFLKRNRGEITPSKLWKDYVKRVLAGTGCKKRNAGKTL